MMYAQSMSQSLCVLTGRRGVGKTSVIRYVCRQWEQLQTCKVIYEDFRDETISTPPEYYTEQWSPETRRNFWMAVADEHLTRILIVNCKPLKDNEADEITGFFDFLNIYFRPAAPPKDISGSLDNMSRHLDLIQSGHFFNRLRDPQYKYERLLFAYRLYHEKRRHVKLVIDNVDDKHRGFLNGLLEKLSHLQHSLHRLEVGSGEYVTLTPFIALRPITFRALQSLPRGDGHGWNAVKEIEISQPAALSAIVKKRYEAIRRSSDFGDLSPSEVDMYRILQSRVAIPVTERQVTWELPSRDYFITQTLDTISKAKQDVELVDMANHDMSDAIPAMGDVLKNRHFISEDAVIKVVRGANSIEIESIASDAVKKITIVRCLAYGNQGNNIPRYPVEDSRVANILHGRHTDCRLTMAKGRVIQALAKANQDDRVGVLRSDIIQVIADWCSIDRDRTERLLDEMWSQGLLECDISGDKPSSAANEDVILTCTPRASCLLGHLQSDSVLLLCYRDEIDLAEDYVWPSDRPTWAVTSPWQQKLSMEIHHNKRLELEDVAKIVQQMFCVEAAELTRCLKNVPYGSRGLFSEWFGGILLAELMLEGVRKSFYRYYQSSYTDGSGRWSNYFEEFRLYMESWRQLAMD